MRGFVLVPLIALLAGCSSWMPKPDPQQAWVDLDPNGQTTLQAVAVDGRTLDDDRFFQVPPGSRRLEMRYRFDVDGANIGPGSSSLARDCKLTLEYDQFTAGARYRLVAGGYGFRPGPSSMTSTSTCWPVPRKRAAATSPAAEPR